MSVSRRRLIQSASLGLPSLGAGQGRAQNQAKGSAGLLTADPDRRRAADIDPQHQSWHRDAVARLKAKLAPKKPDAILLTKELNLHYFTGLFYQHEERHFAALFPMTRDEIHWYAPAMNRHWFESWWCTDVRYYFDYPHAEGGLVHQGKVKAGPPVDLMRWTMEDLKEHGLAGKTIAVDFPLAPDRLKMMTEALPGASFIDISEACEGMRRVMTLMQIALVQRAMDYFSQVHAFARDYILQYGTDLTNRSLARALQDYAYDLVTGDIRPNNEPHKAVGISVSVGCRFGVATAYAQPAHAFPAVRLKKGDALQVSGYFTLGNYGGELYRYYQTAPWTPHHEKVWDVVTESVHIIIRESKSGVRCQNVAAKVHAFQMKNGMQDLVCHRPGHGSGPGARHQAPYLALGDPTPIEEGMMFSVEPGLYDLKNGFGYNPSDNLLILKDKAIVQGSVPYTKEWMFLKL
jgi:Xaa-Pro aminopeptidase